MSGSFIYFFHLLAFGLLSAVVIGGWVLHIRFLWEKQSEARLLVGRILRSLNLLSPIAGLLLLVTGVGNIFNLYYGTSTIWYQQGWLVIKIVLFAVLLVNGTVYGPLLSRKRLQIVNASPVPLSEDSEDQLADINKQMTWFYIVQTVLLLGIVFFSVFGTSKHPGYF